MCDFFQTFNINRDHLGEPFENADSWELPLRDSDSLSLEWGQGFYILKSGLPGLGYSDI